MKIIFSGREKYTERFAIRTTAHNLKNVLRINDWSTCDELNVEYDELEGENRIIITKGDKNE